MEQITNNEDNNRAERRVELSACQHDLWRESWKEQKIKDIMEKFIRTESVLFFYYYGL
ncbi:MAG: hypothetical protein LBP63_10465 [Prevotellaceae bacterium]|jgi:hypothetical protein|nr:hypothetical protein [Prevotellaceae bacterium]